MGWGYAAALVVVNIHPAPLYDSRGLQPHLSALGLPPAARLEVLVDLVQALGVLIVGGREVTVLCVRTFPAAELGQVAVVWGLEADGSPAVVYLC